MMTTPKHDGVGVATLVMPVLGAGLFAFSPFVFSVTKSETLAIAESLLGAALLVGSLPFSALVACLSRRVDRRRMKMAIWGLVAGVTLTLILIYAASVATEKARKVRDSLQQGSSIPASPMFLPKLTIKPAEQDGAQEAPTALRVL